MIALLAVDSDGITIIISLANLQVELHGLGDTLVVLVSVVTSLKISIANHLLLTLAWVVGTAVDTANTVAAGSSVVGLSVGAVGAWEDTIAWSSVDWLAVLGLGGGEGVEFVLALLGVISGTASAGAWLSRVLGLLGVESGGSTGAGHSGHLDGITLRGESTKDLWKSSGEISLGQWNVGTNKGDVDFDGRGNGLNSTNPVQFSEILVGLAQVVDTNNRGNTDAVYN